MLTLTASLALLLSAATSNGAIIASQGVQNTAIVEAASSQILNGSKVNMDSKAVVSYVRSYFEKTPILAEVARCESQFRQFDKSGDVLRGRAVAADVGVMQINEYYHKATAEKMGIDLHSIDGNLKYAKYLYDKQGTQPWSASAPCWDK
jgi:hypothetical protein